MSNASPIPALMPLGNGHRFVIYGDSCSGVPGGEFERNFAAVNAALRRVTPAPEFILFPGDHVQGIENADEMRNQWRYFWDHEMAWLDRRVTPVYSATSNHNTGGPVSEAVWREVFAEYPRNGAPRQELLSYWLRRGGLLLVVANTSFSKLGGNGHVETDWLDRALAANADAKHKLVMGHYPAWPVNGYEQFPLWRIVPDEAAAMWDVLVRHGVAAYICSHVIAFDAQEHDGVLQLTTGGAGTNYGPGGFMNAPEEYHHFVEATLDDRGLTCVTRDTRGEVRERVRWHKGSPLHYERVM